MRISDWSSDVCSSDLGEGRGGGGGGPQRHRDHREREARKQLAARCKVIRVRGASFETALTRLLRMRYEIDDVDRGQAAKVPPGRPWRRQSEISSRAGSLSAKAMPMVSPRSHRLTSSMVPATACSSRTSSDCGTAVSMRSLAPPDRTSTRLNSSH